MSAGGARRSWMFAGGVLALLGVSRGAYGAAAVDGVGGGIAGAGVSIEVDPCAGVAGAFLDRVVSAELSGDADRAGGARAVDVHVTCRVGGVVVAATMAGAAALVRDVDLDREDPQARPRVLGVAIAETVAAIRSQPPRGAPLAPAAPPEPTPVSATEPLAPAPVPASGPRPWTVGASGVARSFASLTGFGVGVWASYLTRVHVGLRADGDIASADVGVSLGSVETRMASCGAQGVVGDAWGPFALEGGVGARLGVASLEGHPGAGAVGHTVTGAWGGPIALVVAGWIFAPAWSVVVTAEAGWVARETTGLVADVPSVSLQGGWWSGGLGLAWTP